jgi:hypothetical protein
VRDQFGKDVADAFVNSGRAIQREDFERTRGERLDPFRRHARLRLNCPPEQAEKILKAYKDMGVYLVEDAPAYKAKVVEIATSTIPPCPGSRPTTPRRHLIPQTVPLSARPASSASNLPAVQRAKLDVSPTRQAVRQHNFAEWPPTGMQGLHSPGR